MCNQAHLFAGGIGSEAVVVARQGGGDAGFDYLGSRCAELEQAQLPQGPEEQDAPMKHEGLVQVRGVCCNNTVTLHKLVLGQKVTVCPAGLSPL